MPTRAKILKDQLVVTQPSAREQLDELEHQISAEGGALTCQRCGQMWKASRQIVGESRCQGPERWGTPQRDKPCIVPPGHDIQWGKSQV
eukprot:5426420-Karenia_brevis.AAC.1